MIEQNSNSYDGRKVLKGTASTAVIEIVHDHLKTTKAYEKDVYLARAIAECEATPLHILESIFEMYRFKAEEGEQVLKLLAKNEKSTSELIDRICCADSATVDVFVDVVKNEKTSLKTINRLVSEHRSTDSDIMNAIAKRNDLVIQVSYSPESPNFEF